LLPPETSNRTPNSLTWIQNQRKLFVSILKCEKHLKSIKELSVLGSNKKQFVTDGLEKFE
jgi:hypothetical protein